ncbi:hypothetical protein ZIOFF_059066 [Zingiber officinale]|uniref:Uncharacterized protein n=1 Tax=Zingiber officinale TaxID=94328 RepID=A0A8J5FED4_ZINOF|nr:hypothetical protein ZIOFF_059066 [Zingiber officinale]
MGRIDPLRFDSSSKVLISIIGNAVIDEETNNKGFLDYYWTHAFLANETIVAIHKFCNLSPGAQLQPPECNRAVAESNHVFTEVNVYNIYKPLCFSSGVTPTPKLPSVCLLHASLYIYPHFPDSFRVNLESKFIAFLFDRKLN